MQKSLIVVTGATSGIGKSIAKHFSEKNHPLLLIGLDQSKLKDVSIPNSIFKKVDVTDYKQLEAAIKIAEEKYGHTEAIVNCAGLMLLGQVDIQPREEWQKMVNVNVMGVLNGMQAVLPQMKKRKSGTIINISSIAGRKTFPNHAAYCGTKFAVHAISENIREEVAANNVRIITIAPGVVETGLLSHTSSSEIIDDYTEWKKSIGGALNPDDIARSVIFAFEQPKNVCVREIVIAPTMQQP